MKAKRLILEQDERVADLSLEFVENEVGRHDWSNNWPQYKQKHQTEDALKAFIQTWLEGIGEQCDPSLLVIHIDGLCQSQTGKRWR